MPIDDPIEKIRQIAEEEDGELLGALIQGAGAFEPIFAVAATVKGVFDAKERNERIRTAIRALCDELTTLREKLPSDASDALRSTWFRQAAQRLIQEAATAANNERAILLARATAHGCFPTDENSHRQQDLATYIRDLAQLGTDDIQMLTLMRDVYKDAIRTVPNMNRMDDFTNLFKVFKRTVNELDIHEDDIVALGARLSGFGLAYEVPRNQMLQSPSEHVFRPTRRGLYLLSLLESAETPKEKGN